MVLDEFLVKLGLQDDLSSKLEKVGGVIKGVGAAMGAFAVTAGAAAIKLGTEVVQQFGELEQNLGGSEAVFGEYAANIQKIGEDAYKNLGVSQSEYLATANKMGALFQGSGVEQQKSLDLTTQAMQRAADMASVMGIDMQVALDSVAGAAKGQKSIDYFKQSVGAAGGAVDSVTALAKKSVLPRGKAMFGSTADYMRQFAKNEDALFFVDDGKVCLVKAADPPRGQVVSLTPTSGLIGTPEITEDGIKGKCLLMPNFKLNGLVHVQGGETGSGIYKIIEFTHLGDNRGNEWYTSFVGVAQPGTVPVTGNSYSK